MLEPRLDPERSKEMWQNKLDKIAVDGFGFPEDAIEFVRLKGSWIRFDSKKDPNKIYQKIGLIQPETGAFLVLPDERNMAAMVAGDSSVIADNEGGVLLKSIKNHLISDQLKLAFSDLEVMYIEEPVSRRGYLNPEFIPIDGPLPICTQVLTVDDLGGLMSFLETSPLKGLIKPEKLFIAEKDKMINSLLGPLGTVGRVFDSLGVMSIINKGAPLDIGTTPLDAGTGYYS